METKVSGRLQVRHTPAKSHSGSNCPHVLPKGAVFRSAGSQGQHIGTQSFTDLFLTSWCSRLPAGSNRPSLGDDARRSLLVSGLEAQLELKWEIVLLEETCRT